MDANTMDSVSLPILDEDVSMDADSLVKLKLSVKAEELEEEPAKGEANVEEQLDEQQSEQPVMDADSLNALELSINAELDEELDEELDSQSVMDVDSLNEQLEQLDEPDKDADDVEAVAALTEENVSEMTESEYMAKLEALSEFDRRIVEVLNATNARSKH